MKTVAVIIGLIFTCSDLLQNTAGSQLQGLAEPVIQTECRDRYLWIHVTAAQTPRFEAIDGDGVHQISEQLAALCGYTISSFRMDGSTTMKASYYSCFTYNQNDEVFTFTLNVLVTDGGGKWISKPVSVVCSGLIWTHREITCEEDYMEVNVNRDASCGGFWGDSGQGWQEALSQAQRTASSVWQLMILKNDGQVSSMSVSKAQEQGFSFTTSAQRIVLRSPYKQPHAELTMVDGIPVMVVRASLFRKQKLTVVMIDASMACTVNPGSFDGAHLLWDVPLVLPSLTGEGPGFESRNLSLGVEGVLLDKPTTAARGFGLVQEGNVLQIRVPFGAKGGYRKSIVENNSYKEKYVIFLLYEHVFSLLFDDGSSIDTKHRMLRVLDTPLLCRKPFSLDKTRNDDRMFSVYLGNVPADVVLEEIHMNGYPLMSQMVERGLRISAVETNGTQAFEVQLPFEDAAVHWTYLGHGVVQYSADVNFTLTIMPQRNSYHYHTSVIAQVSNSFPPEITAQCSEGGISFSVVKPPRAESLWEVGVDHEPLTSELAAQRGYRLYSDTDRTALEVPVFSIGFTYEDINLSDFYGTFQLLLRDSKTLEIQTSTSKRCLFKTQDMIVCSTDGTMTVVTGGTSTWPTVRPERTTLLDPSCGPIQTDGSRVLFKFKLNSCGTRVMVGESYMLYENEILHDRQLITDGPNSISRESQFKLTVRCFYPLSGVSRLSVDRKFPSQAPGFGSVRAFKSFKDSNYLTSSQDCSQEDSGPAANMPTNHIQQTPVAQSVRPQFRTRPLPRSGSSNVVKVPGEHSKLLYSLKKLQNFPDFKLLPPQKVPMWGPFLSGNLMVQPQEQPEFRLPTVFQLHNNPPMYGKSLDGVQLSYRNAQTDPNLTKKHMDLGLSPPGRSFGSPLKSNQGSFRLRPDLNLLPPSLAWNQPSQNSLIQESQDMQSFDSAPSMPELDNPNEADLDSGLNGLPGSEQEMAKTEEVPDDPPQSPNDPSPTTELEPVFETPAPYSPGNSSSNDLNHNPENPGSIERRNADTVWSKVQKPQSKFVSSEHSLNQETVIQQAKPQGSNTSHDATGLNTDWSDRNGTNIRGVHVPNVTQTQELVSNHIEQQQELVHPVLNQSAHQQPVIKPAGASHTRVELVSGLQERSLTPYEPKQENPGTQTDTAVGTNSTPIPTFTPPYTQNTPANISGHQLHSPHRLSERDPATVKAVTTSSHSGFNGSGSSDSNPKIQTRSDYSQYNKYGASVHQGIIRGTKNRHTHT
ncbi:uncharacterized protein LOC141801561 [Halichoeres trimaculatus]|uniref:uncharacterized protein LOC141801561 n=1 Tax=Halichoeres trimaculatus TaxID=147232 RepID=UPI003D9F0C8B